MQICCDQIGWAPGGAHFGVADSQVRQGIYMLKRSVLFSALPLTI